MSKLHRYYEGTRTSTRLLIIVALCALCIAINILGAQIALAMKLPVYLDSAGTMLAAILGGYVPAIIVGYLTNVINGIADSTTMLYGIINVLIALLAAFLAKRGWFKELPLILLSIPVFALISGGLGSLLTSLLYGMGFGNGPSAQLAYQFYEGGLNNVFFAQLCADLIIDLIDKALTVLFVALIYHLLPDELLAELDFTPWQQAPLSQAALDDAMSTKPRVVSLQTKFMAVVGVLMAFVAVTTAGISYALFHQSMVGTQSEGLANISSLVAPSVNAERIDEYLTKGEEALGYNDAKSRLAKTRDLFPGVQSIRVFQIRDDGCHVVFDPGTADEPGLNPGDVVAIDPAFAQFLPDLLAGGEMQPTISNGASGRLLTAYTPLKNNEGLTTGHLEISISMARLMTDEQVFLTNIIALFAAFFVFVCAIILWLARYGIILPLNSIARASDNFSIDDASARDTSSAHIDSLDIRTGDEIENMYGAINEMSQEAVRYTADAQEKSAVIERMQDNLIMVMADLVESRDKFTGDHVRNTAAYTRIAMNQMRREGIYPDELTNEFISNVYKSAPLHDVGKISVSDTILNKPGRFTDEEFEIMKNHTIAGQRILESAKGAVSEPSYLDEAQRLAAYHHEKWNGSGYPYGLEGEEIPLSARIMAVADVFDALVSKRSYKEGFSTDKALAIIEEGIGTHFDPQVARAFLHAQDKAKAVAKSSEEKKRAEEERAAAAQQPADHVEAEQAADQAETKQADAAQPEDDKRAAGDADASGNGTS